MTLLSCWLRRVEDWNSCFPQARSSRGAVRQALGSLVCLGRRCLSRIIWTNGGQHRSWSIECLLHWRCRWEPQALFAPLLRRALPYCPGRLVGVARDETRRRKTGRSIPQAFYQRDPLSPPFHLNLVLGLRFVQASLLVRLHRLGPVSTRALPIRFEEVSRVKKPSRPEAWKEFKRMTRLHNLSQHVAQMIARLRQDLDQAGGRAKILVLAGDGSFCNRTCLRAPRDRTDWVVRTRKDAALYRRAPQGSHRFYDVQKFTSEQVRQDETRPWQQTKLFYGGKRRKIRYKELGPLHWRTGAARIPLRLWVVAPTPHRKRKSSKLYYRRPAYLLTTDLRSAARLSRGRLQRTAVGLAPSLWDRTRPSLSAAPEVAPSCPPALLPRPGHSTAPGNDRTSGTGPTSGHPSQRSPSPPGGCRMTM